MLVETFAGQNRSAVLLGFLLFSAVAFAQELPSAKPEAVGLSSERLERIGSAVQHEIDDKRIAGAVTLVVRRGQGGVVQIAGHGGSRGGKDDAHRMPCSASAR